ncbi:MAG: hypothetical protein KAT06_02320 [Gammaproteobacteria bacterium]|nr:hypothetical protein [Gammaproteobacteria bacterium]
MEYLNQLEKMLESGHRIITMESYEVDRVCDLFLELSRFSSKPYYLAQPEQAMHRFGASHIGIPKTNKPEDLMEHIEASQHFGIYILRNYTEILDDVDMVEDLISIATGDTHKVVVMIAEHIKLPDQLIPYTVRSKHQMKNTG